MCYRLVFLCQHCFSSSFQSFDSYIFIRRCTIPFSWFQYYDCWSSCYVGLYSEFNDDNITLGNRIQFERFKFSKEFCLN
nr:hypothetical protein Iba_scaffold84157CG0010 [Ipomoea batatas]GME12592.1 hypothetical protein Iba_scaffold13993CG0020 [Ipomoea batatas]